MKKNIRQHVWTRYWEKNLIDSCSAGVESKDSEINSFWVGVSEKVSSGNNILDLCSGNGALIKKLKSSEQKNNLENINYIGIDLSTLIPETLKREFTGDPTKLNYLAGVDIENTTLPNDSVDMVVSQFGLEYSNIEKSIPEISRVLEAKGSVHLVLHHSDSILNKNALEETQHIDFLLDKSNYFELIEKMIGIFSKLKNPANIAKINKDQTSLEARAKFNLLAQQIELKASQSICADLLRESLQFTQYIFNLAKTDGKKKSFLKVESYRQELVDYRVRTLELVKSSLDVKKMDIMKLEFEKYGFNIVSCKGLKSNRHLVAWGLELKR